MSSSAGRLRKCGNRTSSYQRRALLKRVVLSTQCLQPSQSLPVQPTTEQHNRLACKEHDCGCN